MTRLVSLFFVAIALMLAAYWVVPGAKPPEMAVVAPPPAPVASGPAKVQAAPPAPLAQVAPAAPPVEAAAPRIVKTAENGCDADPIKCMLDGRNTRPDPTEMTGTIVQRKPAPKAAPSAAPKPPVRPHP